MKKLTDSLEESTRKEADLHTQLRESKRKFTDLEGKLKEDLMMARIRDTENSQCVAELTQKISNLEFIIVQLSKYCEAVLTSKAVYLILCYLIFCSFITKYCARFGIKYCATL